NAEILRIFGIECVLSVDERGCAAGALGVGDGVQCQRGLARCLGAIDLDDPAARQTTDAERDVESDGAGRDYLDRSPSLIAEAHDGALAELPIDLSERGF